MLGTLNINQTAVKGQMVNQTGHSVTNLLNKGSIRCILALSLLLVGCQEDVYGCTDEDACNYDFYASVDDQTCLYNNACGDINVDYEIDIFDIKKDLVQTLVELGIDRKETKIDIEGERSSYLLSRSCPSGGIGRREGFKILWP